MKWIAVDILQQATDKDEERIIMVVLETSQGRRLKAVSI